MKAVRKVWDAIGTVVFTVLAFIFFVRPGSQQADWSSKDEEIGTSLHDMHLKHEAFAKRLQADHEDRRRRGHDQHYGYNW